jgi:hypothetical protein
MSDKESSKPDMPPRVPNQATKAGVASIRSAGNDFGLFSFLTDLAVHPDYVAFVAERALAGEHYKYAKPGDLAEKPPRLKTGTSGVNDKCSWKCSLPG